MLREELPIVRIGRCVRVPTNGLAAWIGGQTSAALTDSASQMLFNVDAHCDDGRRYIVCADELLSAFLELEVTLLL